MADDTRVVEPVTHPGLFNGNIPKASTIVTVVAVPDDASAGTVYTVARIPSGARILPGSFIYNDDLETSTDDPTLDVGLAAVDGNITSDVDAVNAGIDLATASQKTLVADAATWGQKAWEFVNGQASDPGGFLDVTLTILDHPATEPGDIVACIEYAVD